MKIKIIEFSPASGRNQGDFIGFVDIDIGLMRLNGIGVHATNRGIIIKYPVKTLKNGKIIHPFFKCDNKTTLRICQKIEKYLEKQGYFE